MKKTMRLSIVLILVLLYSCSNNDQQINSKQKEQNSKNGYEYVDLGLSVKWATCNVGATTPEQFGNFYAWGEVYTKLEYTKENSETWDIELGNISGEKTHDVASLNLGGGWRIPTEYEARELIDKCTWISTTMNGVKGSKVIGPNGNSIFLPAAGYYYGDSHDSVTYNGRYWTSSPYNNRPNCAYYMYFSNDRHYVNWYRRFQGHPIRPVFGDLNNNTEQKSAYPSYLKGVWFTAHAARHMISFNSNMYFNEIDYDDKIIKGRYTINDSVITLYGEDGSQKEGIIEIIDDDYYINGESIGWMVKGESYTEEEFKKSLNQSNNPVDMDKILEGYWVFDGRVDGRSIYSEIEINSDQMVWVVNNNLQYRGTWMYDANIGCIFFNYGSGGYRDLFEFDKNLGIKIDDGKYHKKQSNNYRSNSNRSSRYNQRSSSYSDWTFRTDMDVYNYLASNKFVGEGYTLTFSDGGMVMCTNGNPVTNAMRVERFNEYRAVLSYTSPYIPGSHTIVVDNKDGTINDNGDIYRIR